jgi:hypothetical protein
MPTTTRRRLLQVGSTIGAASLAGCETLDVTSNGEAGTKRSDERRDVGAPAGGAPIIVYKLDGEIVAVDGMTQERLYSGEEGADDAAVLQAVFDDVAERDRGGRVVVRNDVYEIRLDDSNPLNLAADHIEVISDWARLRFHEHPPREDVQVDFTITKGTNVRLHGLVIEGNHGDREGPSRTLVLNGGRERALSNVLLEDCVVIGGPGDEPGEGYAIGGPDNCDHVHIHNCLLRDAGRHAIHPGEGPAGASNLAITNCTILNNGWGDPGSGAVSGGADQLLVANCYFRHNDTALGISESSDPGPSRIVIRGNVVLDEANDREERFTQLGIRRSSGDVLVEGNLFALGSDLAAHAETEQVLVDGGADVTLTDNIFRARGAGDERSGNHLRVNISGRDATVVVTDNRFAGGLDVISEAHESGGRLTVRGNEFDGPTTIRSVTGDPSQFLRRLLVENNVADRQHGDLIVVDTVATFIIRGNTVGYAEPGALVSLAGPLRHGLVSDNVLEGGRIPNDVANREGVITARNVAWET